MTKNNFKVYYINLDRSVQRREIIEAKLNNQNIPLEYERVNAIDGNTEHSTNSIISSTPGVQACFNSHRKVWEKVINGDNEWSVILEDDADIPPDFEEFVSETISRLGDYKVDVDMVYLGYFGIPVERGSDYFFKPILPFGLHCYLLNKSQAEFLLKETEKSSRHHVDGMVLWKNSINNKNVLATRRNILQNIETFSSTLVDKKVPFPASINKALDGVKDKYGNDVSYYLNVPALTIFNRNINLYSFIFLFIGFFGTNIIFIITTLFLIAEYIKGNSTDNSTILMSFSLMILGIVLKMAKNKLKGEKD